MVTWSDLPSSWSELGSTWATIDNPSTIVIPPDTSLKNYQYKYKGVIWGADTIYGVEKESGLLSLDMQSGSREFSRRHGNLPGLNFSSDKLIVFEMSIDLQQSFEDLEQALRALKSVIAPVEELSRDNDWLEFKYPGMSRSQIRARPLDMEIERSAVPGPGIMKFPLIFEAEDPRVYVCIERQLFLKPYTANVAGTELPINFDANFNPTTSDVQGVAHNSGNSYAYPRITVYGPGTGVSTKFTVMNITTGQTLEVETDLIENQQLVMDMEAVRLPMDVEPITVDNSSRYGDWLQPREPFVLRPGDNLLRLMVEGQTAGVECTVNWNCTLI